MKNHKTQQQCLLPCRHTDYDETSPSLEISRGILDYTFDPRKTTTQNLKLQQKQVEHTLHCILSTDNPLIIK